MVAGEIDWFTTKPVVCVELTDGSAGLETLNGSAELWPPAADCADDFADEVSDWKACNAVDAAARASNIRELRYPPPGAACTPVGIYQQTPCHHDKANNHGVFCASNGSRPPAIDAAPGRIFRLPGVSGPHCPRTFRVLREDRSVRF
jgi:hypothetical protein